MSEPTSAVTPAPFEMLGDPNAVVCEGDFCELPDHREYGIVSRRLDDDKV